MVSTLSPQDEYKAILMILRDARKAICRRQPKADFSKSKVKFQKIVFLVAEELKIPITRSWYLYGGYVHSDLVDIEAITSLEDDQTASFDLLNQRIEPSEVAFKPEEIGLRPEEYHRAIERIAPEVFFSKLEKFLMEFYKKAPEPYKNFYFCNTKLNRIFKDLEEQSRSSPIGLDEYFVIAKGPSSAIYDRIGSIFSEMLTGFAKHGFEEAYGAFFRFSEILERYAVKLGFNRKGFQKLGYLSRFYNSKVWKVAALRFSIATVEGVRAEEVRSVQDNKLKSLLSYLPYDLDLLESELKKEALMPSYREMVDFYEKRYGNGGELARALVEAMRANE